MSKMRKVIRLLPVWAAISAVIILAGIVLMAVLGFNTASERPESYVFEVDYGIVVHNDEKLETGLGDICTEAFSAKGLSLADTVKGSGVNTAQDQMAVRYIFTDTLSEEVRTAVEQAIDSKIEQNEALKGADIFTVWHVEENVPFTEADWRGGVAIAVGALVGLIYVGIRFGLGSAITGAVLAAHDSLFTVSVLAIARIPVYASAPVFYAAIAAVVSVLLWAFVCMKLKGLKKDPDTRSLPAEDAVEESANGSRKCILGVLIALVAAIAVLGGVATAGVRALVLPAFLPVAAAAYSSLVLGPAVHARVKALLDKLAYKRNKGYAGKQKAQPEE